jgi:hypothetical protein
VCPGAAAPPNLASSANGERVQMSKKTKKRKLKARRNKANHGKKPNTGRR